MSNEIITKRLTGAQQRALLWLPADGSWTAEKPGKYAAALQSLGIYHKTLCERQDGPFGPRGGYCTRRRLKPDGVALRAKIEHEGAGQ